MKYWNKLPRNLRLTIMVLFAAGFTYLAFTVFENPSIPFLAIFIDAYVLIQLYKLIRYKHKEIMIIYIIVYTLLSLVVMYSIRRGDWFVLLIIFDPFIAYQAYKEYSNIY